MKKFFYSFGTDERFPFQAGWIIMYANSRQEADEKFRTLFPDRQDGILNCSFVYNEARWAEMDPEHTWTGWKCHGSFGAIPPYIRPEFCKEALTDEIMSTALERWELNTVDIDAMRDACFERLAYDAIFLETYERVEKELPKDAGFQTAGVTPAQMVSAVATEAQNLINDQEISVYREKYVDPRMVKIAMESFGLHGKDPALAANLIAAYVVIGAAIEEADRDVLEAANLTRYTVAMLANDMLADDMNPASKN